MQVDDVHLLSALRRQVCNTAMGRVQESSIVGIQTLLSCCFGVYEIDGQVLFGEYTFFHFGGIVPFVPDEWDRRMGELFVLPPKTAPRHDSGENGR